MAPILIIILFAVLGFAIVSVTGYSSKVKAFAQGIADGEGFGVPDALPTDAHNPGDLELGDLGKGYTAVHHGQTYSGTINKKTIFGSDSEGWNALYKQVDIMLSGRSEFYSTDNSLADVARIWTGGDNPSAWLNALLDNIGSTNSSMTLGEYANS
jgi:hypothetical protein